MCRQSLFREWHAAPTVTYSEFVPAAVTQGSEKVAKSQDWLRQKPKGAAIAALPDSDVNRSRAPPAVIVVQ